MATRKEVLNVHYDLDFDGDVLTVYLSGTDVTSEVKEALGKELFQDLENSFRKKERDHYREWKDEQTMEGASL